MLKSTHLHNYVNRKNYKNNMCLGLVTYVRNEEEIIFGLSFNPEHVPLNSDCYSITH